MKHANYNDYAPPAPGMANMGYQYKYNEQELQTELGLNLYDMPLRDYDPAIGRWSSMDPVVDFDRSPYNGFDNNPVFWSDPTGAYAEYNWKAHDKGYMGLSNDGGKNYDYDGNQVYGVDQGSESDFRNTDVGEIDPPGEKSFFTRLLYAIPVLGPTIESSDKIEEGEYLESAAVFGSGVLDLFTLGFASKYKTATQGVVAGTEIVLASESLGAGKIAVKQWLQHAGKLERNQLIKEIENAGFKKVFDGKGMMHFERGGMKIRLDPPQPGTSFNHMHLNYGGNKNTYDVFLKAVNYKSPAAHIPIK